MNWGLPNNTTGQWSGTTGMIERDEADYAIVAITGSYDRSKVAAFTSVHYLPFHWISRAPRTKSPIWNLLGLFTEVQMYTCTLTSYA